LQLQVERWQTLSKAVQVADEVDIGEKSPPLDNQQPRPASARRFTLALDNARFQSAGSSTQPQSEGMGNTFESFGI